MQYLVAVPVRLIWLASFVAFEMFWYAIIPIITPIMVAVFTVSSSLVSVAMAMMAVFLFICALYALYVVIAVGTFLKRHPESQLPEGDFLKFRNFLNHDVKLLF